MIPCVKMTLTMNKMFVCSVCSVVSVCSVKSVSVNKSSSSLKKSSPKDPNKSKLGSSLGSFSSALIAPSSVVNRLN